MTILDQNLTKLDKFLKLYIHIYLRLNFEVILRAKKNFCASKLCLQSANFVGRSTGSSEMPSSSLEWARLTRFFELLRTSELPVQRPTQLVEYLPPETFFCSFLSGAADLCKMNIAY